MTSNLCIENQNNALSSAFAALRFYCGFPKGGPIFCDSIFEKNR